MSRKMHDVNEMMVTCRTTTAAASPEPNTSATAAGAALIDVATDGANAFVRQIVRSFARRSSSSSSSSSRFNSKMGTRQTPTLPIATVLFIVVSVLLLTFQLSNTTGISDDNVQGLLLSVWAFQAPSVATRPGHILIDAGIRRTYNFSGNSRWNGQLETSQHQTMSSNPLFLSSPLSSSVSQQEAISNSNNVNTNTNTENKRKVLEEEFDRHVQDQEQSQQQQQQQHTTKSSLPLPEIFIPNVFAGTDLSGIDLDDERLWVPQTPTVSFRPLCLCVSGGYYVNLLRVRSSSSTGEGILSCHRHPNPVHGFVLKGSWRYLEHDWIARPGSYIFEPPGEIHTLVTVPSSSSTPSSSDGNGSILRVITTDGEDQYGKSVFHDSYLENDTSSNEYDDEMITLFHVTGALLYCDKEGQVVGVDDVFTKLKLAKEHYAKVGLGEDFVDQFVR